MAENSPTNNNNRKIALKNLSRSIDMFSVITSKIHTGLLHLCIRCYSNSLFYLVLHYCVTKYAMFNYNEIISMLRL